MKKVILALLAMAMVLLGVPWGAQADTITVHSMTYGYQVNIVFKGSYKTVSTTEDLLTAVSPDGTWDHVYGYCVDLAQSIGTSTYTSYDLVDPDEAYITSSQIDTADGGLAAAWLMNTFCTSLNGGTTDKITITALQIAIWEVVYDYDGTDGSLNLSRGDFKFSSVKTYYPSINTAVLLLAQSMLDQLKGATFDVAALNEYFQVAISGYKQDLILGTASGGGETPEPASMLLLGSAMAVGGYWRRRRNRKQAPAAS